VSGTEIKVPYDRYEDYCSRCEHNVQLLTLLDEYLKQAALFPSERGNVSLSCSKFLPCSETGKWESTVFVARIKRSVKANLPLTVLAWSAKNRAEDGVYGYYYTEEVKRLIELLKTVPEGLLVGVMGYSGQGKTALKRCLTRDLKRFYEENEPKTTETKESEYVTAVHTRPDFQVSIPKWDTNVYKYWMEQIRFPLIMRPRKVFLIDTPDYGRKDVRLINRDLTQISEFWTDLRAYGYKANVVVFLQKELVKSQQHFFLLKMYPLLELTPFKPEEMLAAYKQNFGSCMPFIEESLTLVAQLSKGIFRRFMRYINLAVMDMLQKDKNVVSAEDVKAVITEDVLMMDADLEFTEMFRNESQKRTAIKILSFLRKNQEVNQKTVAEALGLAEATVSRLLNQLEDYCYVERRRGEHGEWLVSVV